MRRSTTAYLYLLLIFVISWLWVSAPQIIQAEVRAHYLGLMGIIVLYLGSHVFRMVRLALLTLDERDKAFPLIASHALTAFPSVFFPFKIGEILRLTAFFHVFEHRQKALAVWLAERFGDVLVIMLFILGLYLSNVTVPSAMRTIFVLFIIASTLSLLSLFAVAKVFVYLNRHLVLSSHSDRGLMILKASYILRRLELDIIKSIEGRLAGFFLLSLLVWAFEILALSMFINLFAIGEPDRVSLFAAGLLTSLSGNTTVAVNFGLYQTLGLAVLTLMFLGAVGLAARFKLRKA